jgi:hypothetical protein
VPFVNLPFAIFMGECVGKPLMPLCGGAGMTKRGLHADLAVAQLGR